MGDLRFLDTDGDFIPDRWESGRGLDANNSEDADGDPDRDGLTNLEEYLIGTHPFLPQQTLTDRQLVQLFERKNSLFFWKEVRGPHFLAVDRSFVDGGFASSTPISVAGVGFQLASYVISDDRDWLDHQEVYQRVLAILLRMRDLQTAAQEGISHKHGVFFHFLDENGRGLSEVSTIDHALFLAGALVAGEYYKGTQVERLARQIYNRTDWNFFFNGDFLYLAWYPDGYNHQGSQVEGGNWGNGDSWNRYSEELVMYLLAFGSPTHPLPRDRAREIWNRLSRPVVEYQSPVTGQRFAPYIHVGSLFTHQYSHAFVDFRRTQDDFFRNNLPSSDYFLNSLQASLVNRRFAFDLNDQDLLRYETYAHNNDTNTGLWGLSAADRSDGYGIIQPEFSSDPLQVEVNNDSGTVVPGVAIASFPFIPGELLRDLRFMYENRFDLYRPGESIVGKYGFVNAFNAGFAVTGAFRYMSRDVIGIDLGAAQMMMENFRSGLPWKFFMRRPEIRDAMNLVGFVDRPKPFIMNFDSGSDPNEFGGLSGGFGPTPATLQYEGIGDPFPEQNFGPQQYAVRIQGFQEGDGAWLGLNGHDVSRSDRLSFWIRGTGQDLDQIRVGLKDVGQTEFQVPIQDYGTRPINEEWQEIRIPLRVFSDRGVRLVSMDNVSFTFYGDAGERTIGVDDIAFLGDEFRPSAPPGLTARIERSTVNLSWRWNPEPDVVGYEIYRKTGRDSRFVRLRPGVLVTRRFRDNVRGISGRVTYKIVPVDNGNPPNRGRPAWVSVT